MSTINYDLSKIKCFIFDVDGVLSPNSIPLSPEGEPMRMVNIKDGYALNMAVKHGYGVAIITGADTESVRLRFSRLGIKDIYMKSSIKINDFNDYISKTGYKPEEIIYSGDDLPDYHVMKEVGLPVAPADAAPEIRGIAKYISHCKGGEGVARDLIEQVLKVQGNWMSEEAFGW
ncbi:HAD family hydrolase [Dysgonomonas sp. 511]|uniref:KdsC family phosphatase n=1 Tax=Dysgonomonas sp. 511 TaxID=2302930 RepID=UPI0013D6BB2E|nr:HAD-IIIA family hydrolase [Dysgonomonas sp. 511]NDV77730.1 HAD-IIIA family hydrolase [Dysgonomonas sp. 511]